jgi:hypothetical protein
VYPSFFRLGKDITAIQKIRFHNLALTSTVYKLTCVSSWVRFKLHRLYR